MGMLAICAVLAPAAQATGGNLLLNGGFELGLDHWTKWGDPSACSWTTEGGALDKALRLKDTTTWASCGVYQAVGVTPGLHYEGRFTVYVHSGTAQLYVRWVDGNGNDVGSFPVDTTSGTGQQTLFAEGTAPSGATHARFWLYCTTSLTCDVTGDDAELFVGV